jgi:hypothetical protein
MRHAAVCLLALACDRAGVSAPPSDARAQRTTCADCAASSSAAPRSGPPLASANDAVTTPSAAAKAPAAPSSSVAPPVERDPLLAEDGTPLPQTDERPSAESPALLERTKLLVDAILHDDPARALPAFFPVVAYEQVKAIEKPARDWKQRLVGAFERNIHEYHRALGRDVRELRLVRFEIPESGVRWMKPGSEGNKLGYYRVLRSTLRLESDQGKTFAFEVTSLISWRGEWYVVHLNGFR